MQAGPLLLPSASAKGGVLPYAGYRPAPEQEGNTAMNLNKLLTALRQRKNTPARDLQAGRHERYTHALEQFLDGQPAVRLGGAYTLTSLADEWLTDTSLPEQVRREEAQTIIDALTGCIRTPYPLAKTAGSRSRRGPRRVRRRLYARSGGTTRRAAGTPHSLHGVQPPPRRRCRKPQERQRREPTRGTANITHVG